jgi:hemerythrin
MAKLTKLEWEDKYSVDIAEVDKCQKKVFDLFNELVDMKSGKIDAKEVTNKISEINDFAKLFFSTEEKFLRKKGYPDYQNHAKAHRQFIKSAISLRREISDDISNLTDDVLVELRDWLINHITTMDTLFVPFIRINSYLEEIKHKN